MSEGLQFQALHVQSERGVERVSELRWTQEGGGRQSKAKQSKALNGAEGKQAEWGGDARKADARTLSNGGRIASVLIQTQDGYG